MRGVEGKSTDILFFFVDCYTVKCQHLDLVSEYGTSWIGTVKAKERSDECHSSCHGNSYEEWLNRGIEKDSRVQKPKVNKIFCICAYYTPEQPKQLQCFCTINI